MTDYTELKRLAEAAIEQEDRWRAAGEPWPVWNICLMEMQSAANPAAVLGLIAENEALRKLAHELRGSAECRNVHHCRAEQHDVGEPCKVLARIDAVISKEPQP
ncbi:hypothetical protein THH46_16375 [Pseudomonas sp. NA13]